jgi:hypothetical protein
MWKFSNADRKWTRIGGPDRAFEPDFLNQTNAWPGARKSGVMWGQQGLNSSVSTIFLYGGRTAVGTSNLVWEFNLEKLQWISHPPRDLDAYLPGNTREYASALYSDATSPNLLMYGGWSESEACPRNALWSYDPQSYHWARIYENRIGTDTVSYENDSLSLLWPLPRRDFSFVSSPGRSYVVAGECISLESPWCAPETSLCLFLWEYRHVEQQWTPHESTRLSSNLLRPLFWATTEKLYIFSGIQANVSTRTCSITCSLTANVEILIPHIFVVSNGFWSLKIPSMSSGTNFPPVAAPSLAASEAEMWLRVGLVIAIAVVLAAASIIIQIIRKMKLKNQNQQYELHSIEPHEDHEDHSSSSIHQ